MPGECSHPSANAGSFPRPTNPPQIGRVNATQSDSPVPPVPQPTAPPYVLSTPSFRFRALASLAGRAPLGGTREAVLATYLVARLADDCRPSTALPLPTRVARSIAARGWLANTALPAAIRTAVTQLAEATEGELTDVANALAVVTSAAAQYLDDASRLELDRLARALNS